MVGFGTALAGLGGAMPQIQEMQKYQQQQQAKQIAAQRLQTAMQQYAAVNGQGQPQGAPPPQMGGGMPPMQPSPQNTQAPPAQMPPQSGAPGGAPQGPPMGGIPSQQADQYVQQVLGGGTSEDPLSEASLAKSFFPAGGKVGPADFDAFDLTSKTLRPYGQIQGRQQLETQKENAQMDRLQFTEAHKDSRAYMGFAQQAKKMDDVNLRGYLQQITASISNIQNNPNILKRTGAPEKYQELLDKQQAAMDALAERTSGGKPSNKPAGKKGDAPGEDDVAYLKANPDMAAQFDTHFGKGAAAKVLGQ